MIIKLVFLIIFSLPMILLSGCKSQALTNGQNGLAKSRIITASGVIVRDAPQATGKEIVKLLLGAIVKELEQSAEKAKINQSEDYWYRVALTDGKEGWVFGGLTAPFDDAKRTEIYLAIIKPRLIEPETANADDQTEAKFADQIDLLRFIDQALGEVKTPAAAVGELEFAQLLALRGAVLMIPTAKAGEAKYQKFLTANKNRVSLADFGNTGWMLDSNDFWRLEQRYSGQPLGDRIAWEAVNNPEGGECEGDLSCILTRLLRTQALYLKKYPAGAHAGDCVEYIDISISQVLTLIKESNEYLNDYNEKGKTELRNDLSKLREVVMATSAAKKDAAIKGIAELTKMIK